MKFKIIHTFNWPTDKIIALLSTGEDLMPPEKMTNVSARKVLDLKVEGRNFRRRAEWCVHGQIPKVAQKIISPEMLTFIEETTWDGGTGTFTSRIIPHFLKDKLRCASVSRWTDIGGATRREWEGGIDISIPIIGPLMEKTILEYLKKNCEENAVMVREALTARLGPAAK